MALQASLPSSEIKTESISKKIFLVPVQTADKLRVGYVPSASEAVELKLIAAAVQPELVQLEEKAVWLTTMLEGVESERNILACYRDCHLGLAAPIRKLPVEILIEVFSLCCKSLKNRSLLVATDREASACSSTVSAPTLVLAQTCSLWRSIVLFSPSLWACLHIDLGWRPFDVQALVDLYLQRSGSSPITLHMEAFQGVDYNTIEMTSPYRRELGFEAFDLFESLLRTADRWVWASFDFHLDVYEALATVVDTWELTNMAKLKTLEFRTECIDIGTPLSISQRNLRAPLSNLFFDQFEVVKSLNIIQLPRLIPSYLASFRYISTIEVQKCHTLEEIQHTLSSCPRLRALKIGNEYGLDLNGANTIMEISSDSLETLSLSFRRVSGLRILTLLCFPRLSNLTIISTRLLPDAQSTQLMANGLEVVLCRSPSLSNLTLEGYLLSETSLLKTLSLAPALEEIRIFINVDHDGPVTNHFFEGLSLSSSRKPVLVPNLVLFHIHIRYFMRMDPLGADLLLPDLQTVVSMLESRSSGLKNFAFSARVDKLYDGQCFKICSSEEKRICVLKTGGMSVKFDVQFCDFTCI
ncbi:hypothetical protein VKT23_007805 [Stygiomarasmius scandens]|uniref:F-box domain-containing protein n=1 Tax=Marasmiellus scandens TaxID=2682957 RepID=A0ABR1JN36_9AGAR